MDFEDSIESVDFVEIVEFDFDSAVEILIQFEDSEKYFEIDWCFEFAMFDSESAVFDLDFAIEDWIELVESD